MLFTSCVRPQGTTSHNTLGTGLSRPKQEQEQEQEQEQIRR
jgi:hypothetical protein